MPKLFVYGSVMNRDIGREHGAAAKIDGYRLAFNHVGLGWHEPTFANIEVAENQETWGVLLNLKQAQFDELANKEPSYTLTPVNAVTQDGQTHIASAFTLRPHRKSIQEKQPSARYARMLLQGARYHNLPEYVINQYAKAFRHGNKATLILYPLFQPLMPLIIRFIRWRHIKQNG